MGAGFFQGVFCLFFFTDEKIFSHRTPCPPPSAGVKPGHKRSSRIGMLLAKKDEKGQKEATAFRPAYAEWV